MRAVLESDFDLAIPYTNTKKTASTMFTFYHIFNSMNSSKKMPYLLGKSSNKSKVYLPFILNEDFLFYLELPVEDGIVELRSVDFCNQLFVSKDIDEILQRKTFSYMSVIFGRLQNFYGNEITGKLKDELCFSIKPSFDDVLPLRKFDTIESWSKKATKAGLLGMTEACSSDISNVFYRNAMKISLNGVDHYIQLCSFGSYSTTSPLYIITAYDLGTADDVETYYLERYSKKLVKNANFESFLANSNRVIQLEPMKIFVFLEENADNYVYVFGNAFNTIKDYFREEIEG